MPQVNEMSWFILAMVMLTFFYISSILLTHNHRIFIFEMKNLISNYFKSI